ncbi:OmpA family protein [Halalkalibacter krulwichiae]|uniref:Photosystem I P700 chlorophyll a apoprotein A2 n=1 Tax=Halalkalibacter krulwichiae TaxID=199441 RepID=A0A1X9M8S2_9BACI|nr:OmpA family protein [Halalkalibacter krulwichiae]ARK28593.1 Photosystem I P700 chlorophyll a apoprotein A2 [Halalkalibacter krulwichiae]
MRNCIGKTLSLVLISVVFYACVSALLSEAVTAMPNDQQLDVEAISVVKVTEISSQSQVYITKMSTSRFFIKDIDVSQVEKDILETLGEFHAVIEEETTTLTLPDNILFEFDSYELLQEADKVIEQLVQVIEAAEGKVAIEGHTDQIGDAAYNQQLSEKRAQSVLEALIKEGIDEKRLEAIGYGSQKPIANHIRPDGSDDKEGRQKNRRVEVKVKGVF